MGSAIETISNYMKHGRNAKETKGETCGELRARIQKGFPIGDRAFELRFAKLCGRNFATNRICTKAEVEKMEAAYPIQEDKMKRVLEMPESKVAPAALTVKKKKDWFKAFSKTANSLLSGVPVRKMCLFSAFIIPTIASVSNTFLVSHALSGNAYTSAALTGVASATSILFLWAGVKGATSWAVVLLTLGFEAFCNAASVFKSLMASLAYSITTVSGKPSDFLDMVSNFIGRDHQDVAKGIAYLVAVMIASAQVSSLYELKK